MPLLNARGRLTMLRVHDVGGKFGPPHDQIDVEVVFRLDRTGTRSYGFTLRNDTNRVAHQGMLDLLRDGFNHNWTVNTDYQVETGDQNGVAIRVWLTK